MEYILTSRQFDFAVTCPRVTGGLSVLGSSLTLVTLARTRTSRGGPGRVYRRLVAALSLYDIVYSGLWAANRVMMPTDYGLLYTHGNTASCTAQGFLLQWSTGTFAYSMWISLYYVAVVRYRVTERTLATCFEPLAHGLTLVYCLGWAITVWAMDMIGVNGGLVCSFTTKPFPCGDTSLGLPACTSGQWYDGVKWMALLGPAALYSFVIFASLVMVGVTVVHQRRKVQRTLLGNSVGLSSSSSLPVPASSTSMATPEAVPASATHSARDVHNPAQKRDGQLRQVTTQCILYGVTFFNTIFWQCLYLVLMLTEKYQKDPARLYWVSRFVHVTILTYEQCSGDIVSLV